jgi:nicotinate-nucleotide adenylyltransferase
MFDPTDERLAELREQIKQSLTPKRAGHILAVEDMAVRLGKLYADDAESERVLRAAALLHDVTKEKKGEEQLELCIKYGITLTVEELCAPKTHHARTATEKIRADYPDLADERVLSAVRYHTTGRADMSIYEKLVFLADYIDDSRTFPDCVRLRSLFWDAEPEKMNKDECVQHLYKTLLLAFDLTLKALEQEKSPISVLSIEARNSLILKLNK